MGAYPADDSGLWTPPDFWEAEEMANEMGKLSLHLDREEEEEEEASQNLFTLLSWPRSSSTTSVLRSWLVLLVQCSRAVFIGRLLLPGIMVDFGKMVVYSGS